MIWRVCGVCAYHFLFPKQIFNLRLLLYRYPNRGGIGFYLVESVFVVSYDLLFWPLNVCVLLIRHILISWVHGILGSLHKVITKFYLPKGLSDMHIMMIYWDASRNDVAAWFKGHYDMWRERCLLSVYTLLPLWNIFIPTYLLFLSIQIIILVEPYFWIGVYC